MQATFRNLNSLKTFAVEQPVHHKQIYEKLQPKPGLAIKWFQYI